MAAQLETRVRRLEGRRSALSLADFTVAELREAKRQLETEPAEAPASELVQRVASAVSGGTAR